MNWVNVRNTIFVPVDIPKASLFVMVHMPGIKNRGRIAEIRDLVPGQPAVSPATFRDMNSIEDFRHFTDRVREIIGGIPIGFKLSANHIERNIAFALKASADYIILDGRGGGTGLIPIAKHGI